LLIFKEEKWWQAGKKFKRLRAERQVILAQEAEDFLDYLSAERAASVYTCRNYRQALEEFSSWYETSYGGRADWLKLKREDFRSYLRSLGARKLKRARST
jgi:site-specific recombinase XerD